MRACYVGLYSCDQRAVKFVVLCSCQSVWSLTQTPEPRLGEACGSPPVHSSRVPSLEPRGLWLSTCSKSLGPFTHFTCRWPKAVWLDLFSRSFRTTHHPPHQHLALHYRVVCGCPWPGGHWHRWHDVRWCRVAPSREDERWPPLPPAAQPWSPPPGCQQGWPHAIGGEGAEDWSPGGAPQVW